MVGGQRPPLPQAEALRRRPLWKPEASPPAGRSPEAKAKASMETRCLPSRRAKLCLCLSLTPLGVTPLGRRGSLYRSYSLYIPLSMPLCFWPCLSFSFALPETNASNTADLYHMVGGQRMLSFFVSSLPAFLNF